MTQTRNNGPLGGDLHPDNALLAEMLESPGTDADVSAPSMRRGGRGAGGNGQVSAHVFAPDPHINKGIVPIAPNRPNSGRIDAEVSARLPTPFRVGQGGTAVRGEVEGDEFVPPSPEQEPTLEDAGDEFLPVLQECAKQYASPFLTCAREDATEMDWTDAFHNAWRYRVDGASHNLNALVSVLFINRIGGDLTPQTDVIRILQEVREYLAEEKDPILTDALRREVRVQLVKRYGRSEADTMIRQYLDPAPLLASPFDDRGILRSVDLATQPKVAWLVDGLFPAGAAGMLSGEYGSGKTFAALSLALSIAFGRDWLGFPAETSGHVLYIAAEGRPMIGARVAGWLHHNGILPREYTGAELAAAVDGRFMLGEADGLRLDRTDLVTGLIRTIRENDTRLVVLDTLSHFLGADQSVNANDDAGRIMGTLRDVANATGCMFLVVHHPGQTNQHRGSGAYQWEASSDFVFVLSGKIADGPVRVHNRKQRDAEPAGDFAFQIQTVGFLIRDGREHDAAIVARAALETARQDDASLRLRPLIRKIVHQHPGVGVTNVRLRLRRLTKFRNEDFQAELLEMLDGGFLEDRNEDGGGRAYALHDVPEAWEYAIPEDLDTFSDSDVADLSDITEAA